MTSGISLLNEVFVTRAATYSVAATGGVIMPMARFETIIAPKNMGSMPYCCEIGNMSGTSSRMQADPFSIMPAKNMMMLHMIRNARGEAT